MIVDNVVCHYRTHIMTMIMIMIIIIIIIEQETTGSIVYLGSGTERKPMIKPLGQRVLAN